VDRAGSEIDGRKGADIDRIVQDTHIFADNSILVDFPDGSAPAVRKAHFSSDSSANPASAGNPFFGTIP
jgi:hypothetical protein